MALEGCLKSLELAVSENKASIIQLKDSEINANKRFETIETDIVSLYSKSANYSDIVKGSTGVGRSSPISSPIVVLPGASETPRKSEVANTEDDVNKPNPSFFSRLLSKSSSPKDKGLRSKSSVPIDNSTEMGKARITLTDKSDVHSEGCVFQKHERRRQERARQRTIVTGTSNSARLKGGPPPVREFFVYSVQKCAEENDIEDYLTENNIDFISVIKVSNPDVKFSSFRVSVPIAMVKKVMDGNMWPEGISVRKFYPPKKDGDGK